MRIKLDVESGFDEITRRPPRLVKTSRTSSTRRAWDCTEDLQPEEGWKKQANCLTVDPDLFFGEDEKLQMSREDVEAARVWCIDCRVAESCLIHAFQQNERFGIWGGLTMEERKRAVELTSSLAETLAHFRRGTLLAMVVRL